jgi:hypothetical protein
VLKNFGLESQICPKKRKSKKDGESEKLQDYPKKFMG